MVRTLWLPLILIAWCGSSVVTGAQVASATLSGRVLDTSGASVSAAAIALIASATGVPRAVETGADGAFTIAGLPPGDYRGPGYRNLDVAFVRRFVAPAGRAVEARIEVFNLTNAVAFGAPNGVLGSAAFGSITTAADPRVVQFSVKFLF